VAKPRVYEVEVRRKEGRTGLLDRVASAVILSGDRFGAGFYRVTVERIPEPSEDDKSDDD